MRNKRKNTRKVRGIYYKITYILAFNCPRVANIIYKTALSKLSFRTKIKSLRFIAAEI